MVEITSPQFKRNVTTALNDVNLQKALGSVQAGFVGKRVQAAAKLPEFEELRDRAREIKNHTLSHIDLYLEEYEKKVVESGGVVHWAETADDARKIILDICRMVDAKTMTKGKSILTEEIDLNSYLSQNGITPIETDLGEYIIQLRNESPSHIIAPAIHVTKDQVETDFRQHHTHLDPDRNLQEPTTLLNEARNILRQKFLDADVGITGANFLVAETGTSIIVTNEGNGDLTQILPKIHIVIASIEKITPTLEDVSQILRVLARSATGQDMSVYTTFSTGPKRETDPDGPEQYHVVLLDNGRSELLGTEFQEILRCIRCGACMNHCPVYSTIGGHAYGWVYPGPMGAVLTPSLIGIEKGRHLPNASTFCGRCEAVCPMRIPLPKLMRHWREQEFSRQLQPTATRYGLKIWAFLVKRPKVYRLVSSLAASLLKLMGRNKGGLNNAPFAGGWTRHRLLPMPEGRTFQHLWSKQINETAKSVQGSA